MPTIYTVGHSTRSFEEFAFVEQSSGADQSHQVGCVDGPPAGLRGVDQLVGHGDSGGA